MQSKASSLCDQCDDAGAKEALTKLADAFRYSDPVSSNETIAIEDDLASYVDELQTALTEGDYANVTALCARIAPRLAERNQMCRSSKYRV